MSRANTKLLVWGAFVAWFTITTVACGDDETGNGPTDPTPDVVGDLSADTVGDLATSDADAVVFTDTSLPDARSDTAEIVQADAIVEDQATDASETVEDGMRIIAVSPERGPSAGGTEILVIGLDFTVDSDVYLGGSLCENMDFVDDTKIICNTPPNPAGFYDLKIINDDGLATLPDAFEYFAPVLLDDIDPDRGPTSGGMPATVTGSGFTANTQVSIGGQVGLGIEVISDTEIRFLTPPGASGFARVQVSNENGIDAFDTGFEYYEPLEITAILPGAGPAEGGTTVVLEGQGFEDADGLEVAFGLLDAEVTEIAASALTVQTPAGAAGSRVDVTVSSTNNGSYTVVEGFYYYSGAGSLEVYQVAPNVGSIAGGTEVVLSGVGLDAVTSVSFGSNLVASGDFSVQTASYIILLSPSASSTGAVDVQVDTGSLTDTLVDGFTYVDALGLTAIDPNTGDVAGGTAVILTGSGFATGATVFIGSLPASAVVVVNETTITANTPPGFLGLADVRVESVESSYAVLEDGFTYTSEVAVFGLSPSKGSVAGGTLVVIRGMGFAAPVTVTFDEAPVLAVAVLDSATLRVTAPPHEAGFVDVSVTVGDLEPAVGPERYLYYNPISTTGGSWGDEILGSVNVTVISNRGTPLQGAYVMLSVRVDSPYTGFTDVNGQVTLSGEDLSGAQTVSATRLGFSSSTVEAVNAENITVVLGCIPENQCFSSDDCRAGFICTCGPPYGMIGICLEENYCGFEPASQEEFDAACVPDYDPLPYAIVTGELTGIDKVDDPGPDERIMGMVLATDPHPFAPTDISPGSQNSRNDDGPYTIYVRTGELALIGLCGIYNETEDVFYPRYMGVVRGLFMVDQEAYEIDIDCNIRLDQEISVKAVNPPFLPTGPNELIHQIFLHFGAEGYFGGFPPLQGDDDEVIAANGVLSEDWFAPLEGELAGLDYFVSAGAYTNGSWPYSRAIVDGVTDVDDLITLPALVPISELIVPASGGGLLVEGYFQWELSTDTVPDFFQLLIYDQYLTIYWDVTVPGDQTMVNLPDWGDPEALISGWMPEGPLLLQILAVDAIAWDIDAFDFNDFSVLNRRSWSINVDIFSNP